MNKRFEQLAEEEREKNRPREDYRGPPQPVNSRFAAAAEADRSTYRERDERGPPPVANSRFAAAAEADRSTFRDERGPPPVANSRFAAAAEADRSYPPEDHGRGPSRFDQDGPYSRNDGPPPQQNSRFAAAAAADRDYTELSGEVMVLADVVMIDDLVGITTDMEAEMNVNMTDRKNHR